jgi:hypothetical protein
VEGLCSNEANIFKASAWPKKGSKKAGPRNSRDKERDIMGIIWDYYEDMTSMTSNMEISWNILEVI